MQSMATNPSTQTMDGSFRAPFHRHTCLGRPEVVPGLLPHSMHQAFAGEAAEELTDSDGTDAARRFLQSNKASASQQRSNSGTSPPLRQEVHDGRELFKEAHAVAQSIP